MNKPSNPAVDLRAVKTQEQRRHLATASYGAQFGEAFRWFYLVRLMQLWSMVDINMEVSIAMGVSPST